MSPTGSCSMDLQVFSKSSQGRSDCWHMPIFGGSKRALCIIKSCLEGLSSNITTEIVAASSFEQPFFYAEDDLGTSQMDLLK